jgi:hypothetical protein
MKKVILQEFVSLDGLAAGPNDSVDFVPASTQGDQRFGQRQMEFLDSRALDTIDCDRFTKQLSAGVSGDRDVLGLILIGSTADAPYRDTTRPHHARWPMAQGGRSHFKISHCSSGPGAPR